MFTIYLERIMENIQDSNRGLLISGELINNLRFADDIDLIQLEGTSLQNHANIINNEGKRTGLIINASKTKTMPFGEADIKLKIEDADIDCVKEFVYLGSLFTHDNDISKEIRRRIGKAHGAMAGFNRIWESKIISINTKLQILRACVFSVLLYAAESWTLRKIDTQKLLSFEMSCYRRILNIRWHHKISNERIRTTIGHHKTIIQIIIKRKLSLFGHICRMNDTRLVKQVVFGRIEGVNLRGRPRREWLDDIKTWCQDTINNLCHSAQDRERWRQIVKQAMDTNGQ